MKENNILSYLFFGALTVGVNMLTYFIFAHILNFSTVDSTIISWFIAATFAFITNKIWVFKSKSWNKTVFLKEATSFYLCRILTGILDVVIMFIFVDLLFWNDIIVKLFSNAIVIILNYIASKFVIFND